MRVDDLKKKAAARQKDLEGQVTKLWKEIAKLQKGKEKLEKSVDQGFTEIFQDIKDDVNLFSDNADNCDVLNLHWYTSSQN